MAFLPNEKKQILTPTPERKPAVPELDVVKTPETETAPEQQSSEREQAPAQETSFIQKLKPKVRRPPPVMPSSRDEVTVKIERILEEGLNDSYQRLSPIAKQEFKLRGEQTALKIRELLRATHVKVKKIFRLILEWLRLLPGINHFFLEQEAKIKADKIITLKNRDLP